MSRDKDAPDNHQPAAGPHDDASTASPATQLAAAFALLRNPDEITKFLYDLCTPGELKDLAERLAIARLLDQGGLSYRDISAQTGASTTTVGRVARFLQHEPHQGYRLVLGRSAGAAAAHEESVNGRDALENAREGDL